MAEIKNTREHTNMIFNISQDKIRIQYAEINVDGDFELKTPVVVVTSKPKAEAAKYDTNGKKLLGWKVLESTKARYKIDKEALYAFVIANGKPADASDDQPAENPIG